MLDSCPLVRDWHFFLGNSFHQIQAKMDLMPFPSYLPILRLVFHTTIPASRDAQLLHPPERVGRWPVMIFSHGLGILEFTIPVWH